MSDADTNLIDGFGLYEHMISHCEEYPTCNSTLCLGPDVHPKGSRVYYTLEYDTLDTDENPFVDTAATECFCAPCFGRIFPFGPGTQSLSRRTSAQDQLVLDGVSHQTVIDTAERLYPDLKPERLKQKDLLDNKGFPDHAFNYPTNSPRARKVRAHTQHEINRDLAAVARYEKAAEAARLESEKAQGGSGAPDASVLLTRPTYIQPKKDWYKRQSLEGLDHATLVQDNKENNQARPLEPRIPLRSSVKSASQLERICYCREVDDGTELLRCSAERCPIGWFHLKCTGLERLPTIHQQFFCCYCSDGIGQVVSKELLEDETELGSPATADFPAPSSFKNDHNHLAPISMEHEDEFDSDYDEDWSPKDKSLHTRVKHWTAINEVGSSSSSSAAASDHDSKTSDSDTITVRAPSPSAIIKEDSGYNSTFTTSSHAESSSPATPYSLPRNPSTITDSTTRNRSPIPSSLSSATSLPATFDDILHCDKNAPSTPLLQPSYRSSKPWGTPINIRSPAHDRLATINEPDSPSPTKGMKRKFEMIGIAEDGDAKDETEEEEQDAKTEIPDSQEDELGEEVPFVLDEGDS